jgi:hypothetical protein
VPNATVVGETAYARERTDNRAASNSVLVNAAIPTTAAQWVVDGRERIFHNDRPTSALDQPAQRSTLDGTRYRAAQDHSGTADVLPGVHDQPSRFVGDPVTASGRERPPQCLRVGHRGFQRTPTGRPMGEVFRNHRGGLVIALTLIRQCRMPVRETRLQRLMGGMMDQAHLCREVRALAGTTPARLLQELDRR